MSEIPAGVEIEKVWLVEGHYTAQAAERRPAARSEHITRAAQLKRAGVIIEVGAYSDSLTSSILLVRADSEKAALAIAQADVYVSAGVWGEITARPFGRVSIRD
jgi:uncharacterized protein YciI